MSMYPAHRGIGGVPPANNSGRLNELLDQIRSEFETQLRTSENYEHQSESPKHKQMLFFSWSYNPWFPGQCASPSYRDLFRADAFENSPGSGQRDAAHPREGLFYGADAHDAEAEVRIDPGETTRNYLFSPHRNTNTVARQIRRGD